MGSWVSWLPFLRKYMYKKDYDSLESLIAQVADQQIRMILVGLLGAIREISPGSEEGE